MALVVPPKGASAHRRGQGPASGDRGPQPPPQPSHPPQSFADASAGAPFPSSMDYGSHTFDSRIHAVVVDGKVLARHCLTLKLFVNFLTKSLTLKLFVNFLTKSLWLKQ